MTGCPDFRRKRLGFITASVLLGMERNPHRDDLALIFQGGISAVFRLHFVAAARLWFFPEEVAEVASMKRGALVPAALCLNWPHYACDDKPQEAAAA
jgi:hypothetical protein